MNIEALRARIAFLRAGGLDDQADEMEAMVEQEKDEGEDGHEGLQGV